MRDRTENQVIVSLIRHGETKANEERRYLGITDEALSEKGREKLLSYKKQNLYPKVDCLFLSPMKRCVETAELLYPELCPIVIPQWEEMDFGQFEYKNYEELKDDARYQAWIRSGGTLGFPEGENREDFITRCKTGLIHVCGRMQKIAEHHRKEPVRAGFVVHGGTIMALLYAFGGKEYFDCQVSNGRGYLCRMNWHRGAVTEETEIQIKVETDI